MGAGFSSVIQPVSTAQHQMRSAASSPADVRASMLSAALAMLVCGCRGVLLRR
jgi:hypothetical protein